MTSILNHPHLGIFVLAWFVADLLIPVLITIGHRLQILDRPGGHKGQARPIPFFGGLGIFAAVAVSTCSTLRFESLESFYPLAGMLFGGVVVVLIGLIDDHRPISAVWKLGMLFAITLVLSAFGIRLDLFPSDFLWNGPNLLLTLLWIVGATSAMNSIDNTDGVAPGLAAIASAFLFYIAWGHSADDAQPWVSYVAIAMVGSCFGMLRYNFPPARIYLGDNGSFFLGYMLAAMLVFAHYSARPLQTLLIPGLVLSVPIFDIVLTTVLRIRDGDVKSIRQAILHCGHDHTAHLLMGLGLSKRATVLTIYGLAITGGLSAILVWQSPSDAVCLVLAGAYAALLFSLGIVLGRARPYVLAQQKRNVLDRRPTERELAMDPNWPEMAQKLELADTEIDADLDRHSPQR